MAVETKQTGLQKPYIEHQCSVGVDQPQHVNVMASLENDNYPEEGDSSWREVMAVNSVELDPTWVFGSIDEGCRIRILDLRAWDGTSISSSRVPLNTSPNRT